MLTMPAFFHAASDWLKRKRFQEDPLLWLGFAMLSLFVAAMNSIQSAMYTTAYVLCWFCTAAAMACAAYWPQSMASWRLLLTGLGFALSFVLASGNSPQMACIWLLMLTLIMQMARYSTGAILAALLATPLGCLIVRPTEALTAITEIRDKIVAWDEWFTPQRVSLDLYSELIRIGGWFGGDGQNLSELYARYPEVVGAIHRNTSAMRFAEQSAEYGAWTLLAAVAALAVFWWLTRQIARVSPRRGAFLAAAALALLITTFIPELVTADLIPDLLDGKLFGWPIAAGWVLLVLLAWQWRVLPTDAVTTRALPIVRLLFLGILTIVAVVHLHQSAQPYRVERLSELTKLRQDWEALENQSTRVNACIERQRRYKQEKGVNSPEECWHWRQIAPNTQMMEFD